MHVFPTYNGGFLGFYLPKIAVRHITSPSPKSCSASVEGDNQPMFSENRVTRLASSLQGVSNAYRGRLVIGNIRRDRKFVMFVLYQLVWLSNSTVLIPSKWRFSWFSCNICTSGFPLNKNIFPTYILHKKPTWHWHVFAAYTPWN